MRKLHVKFYNTFTSKKTRNTTVVIKPSNIHNVKNTWY